MKKLPIGIQTFEKLIEENYVYIDKTQYLFELMQNNYFFMSRPRRFGKSMTISTLEQINLGNKELFKGLWIYDKIVWEKYPIIRLDFSSIGFMDIGLDIAISNKLKQIANEYGIELTQTGIALQFQELIQKLAQIKSVVILIDEYDKPIVEHIDNIEKSIHNRDILRNLYSVIKSNDKYIKFLFITGVSKFAKVSLFSELNNLMDITLHSKYASICGITQEELNFYFDENIKQLEIKNQDIYTNIKQTIKDWYNGYSWDGENTVYNPFSILQLFEFQKFDNYWFQSGTPSLLVKYMKTNMITSFDVENVVLDTSIFDFHDIENISLYSLMFQTGYLTIKEVFPTQNTVRLDYPNLEVSRSFSIHLLTELNNTQIDKTGILIRDLDIALRNNNIEKFIELMKVTFKNVTYPNIENKEKYYHSIFYLVLKLLGYNIQSEVMTIDGRIDVVIHTNTTIYVIEFKTGEAQKALEQIKAKNYHQKYANEKKEIVLVGIGFNLRKKNIGDFVVEKFTNT